ncbi:MAG: DNA-binding protein [Desulfurococcales archaeon ex4484_217_2]|nr:MAG: DNA-binding protein [Desulfurococcales archaeon ex4484_217_2]
MSLFVKFARKYFEESEKDLERAIRALNLDDYPQAIFYAQQSVEKGVKAMLEVRRKVVYNHGPELIGIFSETFSNEWRKEYDIIVEALEYLTEYYTRARYPFLLKGEVYGPSDIVSREIAEKGVKLARKALEVIRDFLRRNSII